VSGPRPHVRAAIITAHGEGGIGIIALTGPGAGALLDRFFGGTRRKASEMAAGSLAHGCIKRQGKVLDEVILARLGPAPSPTGRLYYEVNCHGGVMAVRSVLKCFQDAGAEVVSPGELTGAALAEKASFAELTRLRALERLPRARTRLAAGMLLHQASGALDRKAHEIAGFLSANRPLAMQELESLLETAEFAQALLEGVKVAIVGPPNVGKSTLLNTLLRRERVLVHEEAGTTRDIVSEPVAIEGVPFELMDCAGIHTPADEIEADAVARARALASRADLILLMFDVREGMRAATQIVPAVGTARRLIRVGNKVDLAGGSLPESAGEPFGDAPLLHISARTGENIGALEAELVRPYGRLIRHCRRGGAVLFDRELAQPFREVHDVLLRDGAQRAQQQLRELIAPPVG